ncbi:MAG: hypothetical protein H6Q88_3094, partial [Anaeromyxobacteraceae bacterium]|nr:hypothetical protein [Anaeromyxobacteraceae bacterium]
MAARLALTFLALWALAEPTMAIE